ncbi:hypothetical protein M440DRAFT_1266862 [Trichoderma longibrachiatum ATCC 18648]|uniref:Uncharacterized protein n=1 Tax=Trichoderma longibrachiatum ATCC 18648 TaxID=983965 RepID=A0A2T4C0F2_TRILO|nr:hypothetical protein M440DRAFT_1266862 [Trichoderma longibrachiatum ATCC 18648]
MRAGGSSGDNNPSCCPPGTYQLPSILNCMFWPHQPPPQLSRALITRIQNLVPPRCTAPADMGFPESILTDGQKLQSKLKKAEGSPVMEPRVVALFRATSSTSIKTRCNSADGAIVPCTLVMPALLNPTCRLCELHATGDGLRARGASSYMARPF